MRYLIKSTDEILKNRLGLENGLRDKNVHILDFATGTGTFLLGAIEHIRNDLINSNNQGLWKDNVSSFILKQLYGFEFLIVPYVLAHFRIHEFLEDCGYEYKSDDRLQLYLTNTLDNVLSGKVAMFPKMNEEADMAYKIKNEKPILVVMGNPPYNSKSDPMNSKPWILEILENYKKGLSGTEKGSINDDYIKFIRFAHWKMENSEKGVISVIVNNSFIAGISHKTMRQELMKTFDEIYIFDLHGNMNKAEKCPDGTTDFNIFNIKDVGVCMVMLVKTGIKNNINSGVYFQEIFGTQKYKKDFLIDKSLFFDKENDKWIKLDDDKKWHWFSPVKSNTKYLEEFLGLHEIFDVFNSGIQTEKDELIIHLEESGLDNALKDIETLSTEDICNKYKLKISDSRLDGLTNAKKEVKENKGVKTKIHYRPFDFRHIYYTQLSNGCIGRPRHETMKHFINKENIGLIFSRQLFSDIQFEHILVSYTTVDKNVFGAQPRFTPLYIYDEATSEDLSFDDERRVNFTKTFNDFIKSNAILKNKTPEQILYYIYAVLYSPTYREKYKEDLAYDYPRIPFTDNKNTFEAMQTFGEKLVNLHLLKTSNKTNHGFAVEGDNSIHKPHIFENKLYINDTQYFDNVGDEVFNYSIGGYRVLEKYIKAREVFTGDDIIHLQKVIAVIAETIIIQSDINTSVYRV